MNKHTMGTPAALQLALLALAGCASSSTVTPAAVSTSPGMMATPSSSAMVGSMMRNDADAAFASNMIPHHEQAVAMAKLAAMRAADPRVKDLAARIEAAQGPEIAMMNGWLTAWNVPSAEGDHGMDGMSGMDHGGTMAGMMSDAEMTNLAAGNGADFDKAFLTMMIAHHEGALTMAETELKSGSNSDAKSLAQSIIDGQTREIAEMKGIPGNQ